jgi:hypothetical protein
MGGFAPPMKILPILAIFALATPAAAQSINEEAAKLSATLIVKVMKAQGTQGMQAYVADCYAKAPASMQCFYLDAGASQITTYMWSVMNQQRNPYFFGAAYASRMVPVMKQAGIAADQQTAFLKNLYAIQRPSLYAAYVAKN